MDVSMTQSRGDLLATTTPMAAPEGAHLGAPLDVAPVLLAAAPGVEVERGLAPVVTVGPSSARRGAAKVVIAASPAAPAAPVAPVASAVPSGAEDEPVRRKRGRPRDPLADGRILAAASSLILLRGFDAMTVDEVATTAGVGKATVYRRWAKKEDLAVAAMQRLYSDEMPVPDTGTLRGDLTEVYRGQLHFARSAAGADYMRTLVKESMRDERMAALYRAAQEQAEHNVQEIFERAALRGEIDHEMSVDLVVSLLNGLVVLSTVIGRDTPTETDVEHLVDLVLRGLGTRD